MATLASAFTTGQEIARAGAAAGTWSNPTTGLQSNDDVYSVWSDSVEGGTVTTDWLVASGLASGSSLLDSDVIDGIQVTVTRLDPATGDVGVATTTSLIHVSTSLSSPNGTGKADATEWTTSEASAPVHGGTTDLWGHASLTGADVKAAGFSVWLSCSVTDTAVFTAAPSVERITITFTYTRVALGAKRLRRGIG